MVSYGIVGLQVMAEMMNRRVAEDSIEACSTRYCTADDCENKPKYIQGVEAPAAPPELALPSRRMRLEGWQLLLKLVGNALSIRWL